jgi:Tfp pilus assembly protein PilF
MLTVPKGSNATPAHTATVDAPNYEALGDIIAALNHIDQAQSEVPRYSDAWVALGSIYRLLRSVDLGGTA